MGNDVKVGNCDPGMMLLCAPKLIHFFFRPNIVNREQEVIAFVSFFNQHTQESMQELSKDDYYGE